MSKSTESRKNAFSRIKMNKLYNANESWKAWALWQTLRLSSASSNNLIFRLSTLCAYWIYFGFSPGWFYFLLSRGSFLLAWIKSRICGNSGFGYPRVQTWVQIMFSGLAFSNDKYFSTLATYHPPHFLSDL